MNIFNNHNNMIVFLTSTKAYPICTTDSVGIPFIIIRAYIYLVDNIVYICKPGRRIIFKYQLLYITFTYIYMHIHMCIQSLYINLNI